MPTNFDKIKRYTKEELDKLPKELKVEKLREYHAYLKKVRKQEYNKLRQYKTLFCVNFKIAKNEYYKFRSVISDTGEVRLYHYYEGCV